MNTHLHTFKFSDQPPEHLTLASHRSAPRWQRLWVLLRSPLLLQILAVWAVIGLVLIFHAVVTQAVHQSGLRHQALAAQSQAAWRCKLLPSASARQVCLRERPTASGQ
ncbi:hypothetical protein [Rhodoferax antarcticus]|uniref:Uncharacterized protein n=1 Tax=Rhodoferax antarcticus ANT.BR TaxID=1111071 RepID=A0A1Q8YJG8_9BURK|nr:hypothetical protein [Rhodoferax antarcticus]APW47678.1 hypothetical protein RA876_16470 [Rhodoferax antarcticus]OLP08198.1 hypothetical protein BLL52_0486 [Rhodoferax antarcticus ANT.BR]